MMEYHAAVVPRFLQNIDSSQNPGSDIRLCGEGVSVLPLGTVKGESSAMTVGIAIMCDQGKTVVVASDRMVMHDFGGTAVQTEADCIKFELVNPTVLMLYTGQFSDQQDLVNRVGDIKSCTALDLATKLRTAYEAQHDDIMERTLRRIGTTHAPG